MKPLVVLVHFNKPGSKRGEPWTIHYRGRCIPAAKVNFHVPTTTIFIAEKKSNPRAWIRCLGHVVVDTKGEADVTD